MSWGVSFISVVVVFEIIVYLFLFQGYIGFYHDIIEQAALIAFENMPSLMSSSLADETQTAQVLISIRIYSEVSLLSRVYIVFNTSY